MVNDSDFAHIHGHKGKDEKSSKNGRTKAVAYLRTSSAANVGADKDSEKRQRQAITAYAKSARFASSFQHGR